MRKITEQSISAFNNNVPFKSGNTSVHVDGNNTLLRLHGNLIAKKENGKLFVSNGGWSSTTTKERLNGLDGVSIYQKNRQWYLNGQLWSGDWIQIV